MILRIAAALAAFTLLACAEPVSISTRLKQGDVLSLSIKKSREDSRVVQKGVFTTPVKAAVLEAGADGALVDWTPGEPSADPPEILTNPLVRASLAMLSGIHFEVKLSAEGEFLGLRNEADVESRLKAAVDEMINQISLKLTNEATKTQFRSTANRMLSPQLLINSATRDIQLYFGLGGAEFDRKKPLKVPAKTANPLGGAPIKSDIEYTVQSVTEQGTAKLRMVQTFDPAVLKDSLAKIMAATPPAPAAGQAAAGQAGPGQPATEPPAFIFQDEAEYVIDLQRGLARSIDHKRIIDASPAVRRLDNTVITLHSIHP